MHKKEKIVLDAELVGVIRSATFRAVLPNGHEIIAYPGRSEREAANRRLAVGQSVCVELSPFDMSKGLIVLGGADLDHES